MKACKDARTARVIARKVAAFKRKGWLPLLPCGQNPSGLFTRELLVSADGKWIAKFAEITVDDERDAWSTRYAPFCYDVYTGKRPIEPSARPMLPVMPYFKRGNNSAVAIIERLQPMPHVDDCKTTEERHVRQRYKSARRACYDGLNGARGPVRTTLRAMRAAIGQLPDDLHEANVMLRRGPRGGRPKLVFTDPYAYVRN